MPPTDYENEFFDLIYGLSVLTHVEATLQDHWFEEIYRILKMNGIFLFTTHGNFFLSKLLKKENKILNQSGAFTKDYKEKGHRMMTTYNSPQVLRLNLEKWFEVLEFHDGSIDRNKIGGQDLWIVRKSW